MENRKFRVYAEGEKERFFSTKEKHDFAVEKLIKQGYFLHSTYQGSAFLTTSLISKYTQSKIDGSCGC